MMVGSLNYILLKKIYSNNLHKIFSTIPTLSRQIELSQDIVNSSLLDMVNTGTVFENNDHHFHLTELGRKKFTVVMTGGTFDIIHTGHIFTFEQARMLGDVLVIVIAILVSAISGQRSA